MCGRYASSRDPEALVEEFEIDRVDPGPRLPPNFNVAPTDPVYGVLTRPDRHSGELQRRLRVLRWGLVPSWAKDLSGASRLINARMETVADKPAFRRAFAQRRCLLPADGYFEWYRTEKGPKQPFFITARDGSTLAMAGVYEIWRDRSRAEDDPDAFIWSVAVLTTEAEDDVGMIHDRMPLVVPRERFADWLDPHSDDQASLRALLQPAAPGRLAAYPVSTEVNNVRNNGAHLIEALPAQPAAPSGDTAAVVDESARAQPEQLGLGIDTTGAWGSTHRPQGRGGRAP